MAPLKKPYSMIEPSAAALGLAPLREMRISVTAPASSFEVTARAT